jgi:hypothetical protein
MNAWHRFFCSALLGAMAIFGGGGCTLILETESLVKTCARQSDCDEGFYCEEGACLPGQLDAGFLPDAGPQPDAGPLPDADGGMPPEDGDAGSPAMDSGSGDPPDAAMPPVDSGNANADSGIAPPADSGNAGGPDASMGASSDAAVDAG